jgi:hypothetical protein
MEMKPDKYTEGSHGLSREYFKGQQELLRESLLTDPTGGMYVVNELQNAIHREEAFSIQSIGTIAAGATLNVLGRTGDKEVHFGPFRMSTSKGFMSITFYEAPTTTADGTPITSLNRKRDSLNTATLATFDSPTVTNNGLFLENTTIYDTGSTGGGANSSFIQGNSSLDAYWVLKPNTDYLIAFQNTDVVDPVDYSVHFIWAERDPIVEG